MSFNPFQLAGKMLLVTGATSGIGRQSAITCAEMGAQVIATGRDGARLAETIAAMPGEGHRGVVADLTREDDLANLAQACEALNGIAHCAGIAAIGPFRMISQKHIREIFGINFDAPILLTQRLLSRQKILRGGSIVFVASSAAHIGTPATSLYAASKGALIPAMRALALEVGAKHQMRVNCISPGYVQTPLLDRLNANVASIEANYDWAPLGLGRPSDVANAIVYFLSDASRWVTRTTLQVDGGLTCRISF